MSVVILIYVFSVLGFSLALYFTHIKNNIDHSMNCLRSAVGVIHDKTIEDDEKEKMIKQAGMEVMVDFLIISVKTFVIIIASVLPAIFADFSGITTFLELTNFALRYEVIVITTIVFVTLAIVLKARPPSNKRG